MRNGLSLQQSRGISINMKRAAGIWLTGIPASGKSSIAVELLKKLKQLHVPVVLLESDAMRTILTPEPTYSSEERDWFYKTLASIGALIVRNNVNVIFDATANKQAYRDYARQLIPHFVEIYVVCPLEICVKRDPKGIYAAASAGKTSTVPGLQLSYEPPLKPEITIDGELAPNLNADVILKNLKSLKLL